MHLTTVIAEFFIILSAFCFVISAADNSNGMLKTDKNREIVDLVNCCSVIIAVFFTLIGIIMMIILKIIQCIKKTRSQNQYNKIAPAPNQSENAKLMDNKEQPGENELMDKEKKDAIKDEDFMGAEKKPEDDKKKKEFDFGGFEDDFMKEEEQQGEANQYF